MCILFPVGISDLKSYPCFEFYYLGLQSCRAALGLDTSSLHKVPVTHKRVTFKMLSQALIVPHPEHLALASFNQDKKSAERPIRKTSL